MFFKYGLSWYNEVGEKEEDYRSLIESLVVGILDGFGGYDLPLDWDRYQAMHGSSVLGYDELLICTILQDVGNGKNHTVKCLCGPSIEHIYKTKDYSIKASSQPKEEKYTGPIII